MDHWEIFWWKTICSSSPSPLPRPLDVLFSTLLLVRASLPRFRFRPSQRHTSSIEMMVLHHPNDLDLDLDLGLDLDLHLDLDFRHKDHWSNDIRLYDSTSSQWFYTIPMTLTLTSTLTLISTLTFILSLILLDFFWHYSIIWLYTISIVLHHLNRAAPSQRPWPSTLWPLTLTLNTINHHRHTSIHNTTHHHTPHSYHINVILNVNRRIKLRVIFIKRLHCPESAVIWRKTLSNNYAILYATLYIQL